MRDVGDAQLELDEVGDGGARPPIARRATLPALLALAGLVTGGLLVWALHGRRSAPAADPIQFTIQFPADVDPVRQPVGRNLAISPDGRRIVAVGTRPGGPAQLWVRSLDRAEATPTPGTEGANGPFFSPDGRWVGFFVQQRLKKVALAGGAPVALCNVERSVSHGTWGKDGTILFSGPSLWRVRADGSEPEIVAAPAASGPERAFRLPEILPSADAALYTSVTGEDVRFDVGVVSLKTRERRTVIRGATSPVFVEPGFLIYAQQISTDSGE